MPHFIVDYSGNLHDRLDFQPLFKQLHEYVVSTGVFPLGGVRSRAIRCDDFRVADGREDFAYINLSMKIGPGRDDSLKQEVSETVFAIFCEWMKPVTDTGYCQISFELTELDPVFKFNKNNIHSLFSGNG
ncbi:5-carboxymethyl-2-hydroxymuconate isomerase [Spongorhabdus nitratireducens]